MRYIAFDVGDRRIGIAASDPLNISAQGLQTYTRADDGLDIDRIIDIIKDYEPCELVFGLPKNMDGSSGFQAERVKSFANELCDRLQKTPHFFDERLTSVSAHKLLSEGNVRGAKRKQAVDKIAATIILQGYLETV